MQVLVIDTSSAAVVCGIASVTDDAVAVLAACSPLAARGHGELLTPSIAACLHDAEVRARDIAAVVAGVGPGPYTGLRVGLATAAAFADAAAAPTYAVCSLDAIAAACADEADLFVATDARRREIYHARYAHGRRTTDVAVGRPADLDVGDPTAVAGAGGELYAETWPLLRRRPERYPAPDVLAYCAVDRIRAHAPAERLTPLYLRRPDAVVPGTRKTVTT